MTKDRGEFEKFYREMHIPYTRLAHGASAYIEPFDVLLDKVKEWELLLVKREDESIAGQLISYEPAAPRFYLVGIKDGNLEYLKQRVLGAVYQFSCQHLVEKGYKKAGLGFSRASSRTGCFAISKNCRNGLMAAPAKGLR